MSSLPVRSYMDDKDTVWRNGKPNYDKVNAKFMAEKSRNHKEGSLEMTVENLVKSFEMEISHKVRAEDWKTVDQKVFLISANGGRLFSLPEYIEAGNYNMMMAASPLYDVSMETNESSTELFRETFNNEFAWEVLDVYSGPPTVSFTWRHWGTFSGSYKGHEPTGETVEMFGHCVAKVDEDLKIQSIEVFYDPNPMLMTLTHFKPHSKCPMSTEGKQL